MKIYLFHFLFIIFACVNITALYADTINLIWLNEDGTTNQTTMCQTGGDVILPIPPTKTGYTFVGWHLQPNE